jgi:outer membrane protein, adhesin transport system
LRRHKQRGAWAIFGLAFAACLAAPSVAFSAADPLAALMTTPGDPAAFKRRVADAVSQHPAVLEAIAAQRETQQRTAELRGGLLPTIDFGLNSNSSLSRRFEDANGNRIESLQPKSRIDATLSGQQLITDFGSTRHRIRGSKAREGASVAEVHGTAADVALNALDAHGQLVVLQRLSVMGDEFVERHRKILADTKLRFEQGYGPGGDVARVEAYLARAEGQIANIARDLATARAHYREAFNAPPPEPLEAVQSMRSTASSMDEAISMAEQSGVNVLRARALTTGASEEYAAVRAERWPRLSVSVDATKYNAFDDRTDYDVRARVLGRYNIFNGGQRSARMAQAFQRTEAAQQAENRARSEAARDASIAFEQMTALRAQVDTLRRAAEASNRARDFFVEQFKVARGSLLDLLQAEQDSFETTADFLRARAQLDAAQHALLARTGELLPALGVEFSFTGVRELFGSE